MRTKQSAPPASRGGKYLIMLIVAVALAAATGAWWYQYRQGQRILSLWGADTAFRIRLAPDCELWQLEPSKEPQGDLQTDNRTWSIVQRRSLAGSPGLLHARQALIQDASYAWHEAIPARIAWKYAVTFGQSDERTVLLFDLEQGIVQDADHPARQANIQPIADGLQAFFQEKLSESAAKPTP